MTYRPGFCLAESYLLIFLAPGQAGAKRPEGGAGHMNKYELAVVVSAKLEDEARAEVMEKVKEAIYASAAM